MEGGRLIEGGAHLKVFLSTNCDFILAKSLIEKQKLQHYPRKRNVNINVFFLLQQWLVSSIPSSHSVHLKEICKHMEIEITRSDLIEKKLFSCTDAAVVEA